MALGIVVGFAVNAISGAVATAANHGQAPPLDALNLLPPFAYQPTYRNVGLNIPEEVQRFCTRIDPYSGKPYWEVNLFCKGPSGKKYLRQYLEQHPTPLMPVGRRDNSGEEPVMLRGNFGRPAMTMTAMPPIAGATEFTAPVGAPGMTPRAIITMTPPNVQTPRDGNPGGSFNYNSLLQSLFKWDKEVHDRIATPAAAVTLSGMLLPNAGVWAVECTASGAGTAPEIIVVQRVQPGGIAAIICQAALPSGGEEFSFHWLEFVARSHPTSALLGHTILIDAVFGSASGVVATNIWAKQLSSV